MKYHIQHSTDKADHWSISQYIGEKPLPICFPLSELLVSVFVDIFFFLQNLAFPIDVPLYYNFNMQVVDSRNWHTKCG